MVQVKNENSRQARGLFNFVGKISKTLFGTLDDEDAKFYHEHKERLEQGTNTLTQLMKQQLMIVKSVLCTFNETLTDVEYNEIKMAEGLKQLQRHVNTFGTQLENTTYLLSLKIAIESHIAKALDASQVVQRTLDLLVESLAKAKEGTLPPRVMPPVLLLDALKNGVSSFPPDTTLPFPLSKDYLFLLYQLSDVCVYTYKKRLGYVISVPLVNKRPFNVYRMVPLSLPVDQDHFVYIDVRDAVVCVWTRPNSTISLCEKKSYPPVSWVNQDTMYVPTSTRCCPP